MADNENVEAAEAVAAAPKKAHVRAGATIFPASNCRIAFGGALFWLVNLMTCESWHL